MTKQLLLSCTLLSIIGLAALSLRGGNRHLDDPYGLAYVQATTQDTIPPIQDRYGDYITDPNNNPFDLRDPSAVDQAVEYDPVSGQYIVTERVGETLFRPPTYISFDDYLEMREREDQRRYFRQLGGFEVDGGLSVDNPLAGVDVEGSLIDRLFGGTEITIKPQGSIDLTFGFNHQYVENPILTLRQRRQTVFDFDMAIQMNVTGQIGEKLKLNTNYNTQASFNFDNQIKLDYNSDNFGEDDILKKIEAGNVALPLRGTLIQGAQSLFGLKTELQFGNLRLTAIASQQQSENENITIQGGSQVTEFQVKSDEYDENRHFFLSHYNRAAFEPALKNLPQMNTLFHLEDLEVWVTNDRNDVQDTRDIVAFADLGEPERFTNPASVRATPSDRYREICDGLPLPENGANDLYSRIAGREDMRNLDRAVGILQSSLFGLTQGRDFEKVRARKLNAREYSVHPELGFISINIPIQQDQVLAVSFRYKYNGEVFRVGELARNTDDASTTADSTEFNTQVLYTKLLKSTTQATDFPTWDLMMKNIYSIGAYQVNQEDFQLDVFYEDPGEGVKRFLPETELQGIPLIRVFNLDRLNVQNDPQPDGVFDFVPGVTINPNNGRIIFPVLEPFGSFLDEQISDPRLKEQYVYQELYDLTPFLAREFPEKNRYVIAGSYKSSVASEISLGAFNIPPGSVRVSAGRQLTENVDYEIDYSTGRLRILNDAILSSGVPINVSFEDNTVFGLQNKTMLGLRADYELSDDINIGGTFMQLFERPFTPKVNVGDDPINNRIYGLDFTMNKDAPWLTRLVDKLPFYSTAEPSTISVLAETAVIDPGHARAINQDRNDRRGIVYVDDFEGSASTIDLRQPTNQWFHSSVPQNSPELFPEARLDGLVSGANRARLNWYVIDPLARQDSDNRNPYTSLVPQTEVFPNRNIQPNQRADILVFDLSYYPEERGPYNFDVPNGIPGITSGVDIVNDTIAPVRLRDPETRWGGVMRAMNTNDFQSANIEFVEFWALSPFLSEADARDPGDNLDEKQGTLYLNLGNVSEDILKDSRFFFENGLPGPTNPDRRTVSTDWGRVPVGQQIVRAFDNDPAARAQQDVGLDGLSDSEEAIFYDDYLNQLAAANPNAADIVQRDPATDNFQFYDQGYDASQGVKVRYRRFNNPQGNSGANDSNQLRQSGTNIPDAEDLDRDNTLNETESYFEYKIPFFYDPTNPREIDTDRTPYITDRREASNGRIWYRFRIPLQEGVSKGGIQDFRSIRFMRMYLRDFEAPTTLRFASFDLVRSQWRRYTQAGLSEDLGDQTLCGDDNFQIDAVNIEENSSKEPFNYTLPNGIIREQTLGVFQALQNEQSLALRLDNLCDGDAKAVFKYTEMDMRLYENLQLFVHAESRGEDRLPDEALSLFVRLGSDFKNNYYEYEIPLKVSRVENLPVPMAGETVNNAIDSYKEEVWRPENLIDFPLEILRAIKTRRNEQGVDLGVEFMEAYEPENPQQQGAMHSVKVRGNPNLGFVKVMMIGVRNPKARTDNDLTQGIPYSVEVWANELRLVGLDERLGVAGIARVDMQMADLGTVTVAGNYNSIGFGALDAGVIDRSRERLTGYDLALDLNVDKFFPQDWGLRVPFYAQRSNTTSTPEYDPYDLDIRLKDKLDGADDATARDSLREQAQEIVNITTYNFNNVRKERTAGGEAKPKPWDVENFSVSYGYTRTERSDPLIARDTREEYTGGLNYGFSRPTKYVEPFKGIKSKQLRLLKEFNFNPVPNSFNFSTILDRQFATTSYRFAGVEERFNTFFNKRFNWNRNYDFNWDITRSLKFNFNAMSIAAIDEPDEIALLDNFSDANTRDQFRRDSIWTNVRNLGRPKNYEHGINISYTLPIRYLPYMDWVQVRAQYQGGYTWTAASLNVDSLGNTIQNRQQRQISADLNFDRFYDQFAFLKKYNRPQRRSRGGNNRNRGRNNNQDGNEEPETGRNNRSRNGDVNPAMRAIIRPLLLLRKARISYSEQFQTVVPGFMPETELLGLSSGFEAPGWDFVAGLQPKIRTLDENWYGSEDWLYQNRDWITSNVFLNGDIIQDYSQNFEARLTIEPFADFRIEVEGNRTFTENYTESFKVFDKEAGSTPLYEHRVPTYGGQLTVSYNAMSTMFQNSKAEGDALFDLMGSYRRIISQRLGSGQHRDPDLAVQGYTDGYGRNQQDVLLPAFVAAYTGQDPNSIDLDLFNTSFRPNWRVNYSGLSRLKGFQDIFTSFNISHGYRSTFAINNYGTGLDYLATREAEVNPALDTVSFNLFPRIEIPDLVITDNFAPLLAIEAQLQNGMSFNMDYQQSRNLQMNVTSKQLLETSAQEVTMGFGYVVQGVNIGFLTGRKNRGGRRGNTQAAPPPGGNTGRGRSGRSGGRLGEQDLDIQFNFSYRDDITLTRRLDPEPTSEITRGTLAISLSPSAEYQLNKSLSLRAFLDYRRTVPANSQGFPRTDASGGVVVRFQLN